MTKIHVKISNIISNFTTVTSSLARSIEESDQIIEYLCLKKSAICLKKKSHAHTNSFTTKEISGTIYNDTFGLVHAVVVLDHL